jgi:hypothetical protein
MTKTETTPAGKRRVHANIWGNTNGYVGGRFWVTLGETYAVGTDERVAAFLSGAQEY